VPLLHYLPEEGEKKRSVYIVFIDGFAPVTSSGDMVECAWKFKS
jgi:hypothetical protein